MKRERKRGNVVLGLLKEGALTTTDLLVNIALEPFRHSYKGCYAPLRGKEFSIRNIISAEDQERNGRRKFYNLLTSLKRDGLVSVNKEGRWSITKAGEAEFDQSRKNPKQRYGKQQSKEVIVVSYDIPEKERAGRNWLRSILRLLDFKILHQSVWIGKTEIPETLLIDIKERKISSYIHIFTIGKKGSLTQIM